MPEKTKRKEKIQPTEEETVKKYIQKGENGTWSEDQKNKSYYYDDSYGYEIYKPKKDNERD